MSDSTINLDHPDVTAATAVKTNQRDLELDIIDLLATMASVNNHIKSIERNIESLYNLISNGSLDNKSKANVYRTINESRVTLTQFFNNNAKLQELRLKYRLQQSTLKLNVFKLRTEVDTDVSAIMNTLSELSKKVTSHMSDGDGPPVIDMPTDTGQLDLEKIDPESTGDSISIDAIEDIDINDDGGIEEYLDEGDPTSESKAPSGDDTSLSINDINKELADLQQDDTYSF